MKLNRRIIGLAALALLVCHASAQSQTVSQVPNLLTNGPAGGWFTSAGNYFSSSNPNQPVHGSAEVGLGAAYQSGVNIGADLNVRWKPSFSDISTNAGFGVESTTRNAGIAGTIVSEQVGLFGYYIPASAPDIEMSAGVNGGYSFLDNGPLVAAYLQVLKMSTFNTYLAGRLGVEGDRGKVSPAPVVTVFTGFVF